MKEVSVEYKTTLEAYIELPEKLVVVRYADIEWREDGPYNKKTNRKVAVVASPREFIKR